MKSKYHRIAAGFVGILSGVSAVLIADSFDPLNATYLVKSLFLVSLFFCFWGLGTFILSFVGKGEFGRSYRRGFLLSAYLLTLIIVGRLVEVSLFGLAIVTVAYGAVELIWLYLFDRRSKSVETT